MPPSLVAASALVTAIEQDTTVTNNFNLNQIVTNIRDLTKLEISTMKNCMHLIERIFLQSSAANPNTSLSDSESDFNYDDGGGGGGVQQLAQGQQNSASNSSQSQQHQIIYAQHNRS